MLLQKEVPDSILLGLDISNNSLFSYGNSLFFLVLTCLTFTMCPLGVSVVKLFNAVSSSVKINLFSMPFLIFFFFQNFLFIFWLFIVTSRLQLCYLISYAGKQGTACSKGTESFKV